MANQVVWVDIPVKDLDRAIEFYSAVLGKPVTKENFGPMSLGLLPHENDDVGGCLVQRDDEQPSAQGILIYLNANGRLDEATKAAERHGGKVLLARESLGPYGSRSIIVDCEGNRVALHSM